MNDHIRWKQRFENLQSAHQKLQYAAQENVKAPENELIQMALIKAFEMTFELSWKTIKDYLKFNGIVAKLPREIIKQAFANNIIADGQLWIDMLENRRLMAHPYDQARAQKAVNDISQRYLAGLEQLYQYLLARMD